MIEILNVENTAFKITTLSWRDHHGAVLTFENSKRGFVSDFDIRIWET